MRRKSFGGSINAIANFAFLICHFSMFIQTPKSRKWKMGNLFLLIQGLPYVNIRLTHYTGLWPDVVEALPPTFVSLQS
jgi:hypothetical protein